MSWRQAVARQIAPRPAADLSPSHRVAEEGAPFRLSPDEKPTLLVVEDDPDVAALLVETLVEAGHAVIGPAANVAAAETLAAQHAVDVALIDINLAGSGDGTELARGLRARWGVKTVFMTADVARALDNAVDCDAFVFKPYLSDDVFAAIQRAMHPRFGAPKG